MEINTGHFPELSARELYKILEDSILQMLNYERDSETYSKAEILEKLEEVMDNPNPLDILIWLSQAISRTIDELKADRLFKLFGREFFSKLLRALGLKDECLDTSHQEKVEVIWPSLEGENIGKKE